MVFIVNISKGNYITKFAFIQRNSA